MAVPLHEAQGLAAGLGVAIGLIDLPEFGGRNILAQGDPRFFDSDPNSTHPGNPLAALLSPGLAGFAGRKLSCIC
jgi:hypothetical protein